MPATGRGVADPDARRILAAQAARAAAYGLGSVLIGVTLVRQEQSALAAGVVLTSILAGNALASVAVARYGDRIGRRRTYLVLFAAMAASGTVFALTGSLPALVLAGLTGTVSTDVVESGPFTSVEQAMLPNVAEGRPTRKDSRRAMPSGRVARRVKRGPLQRRAWIAADRSPAR